MKKYPFTIASLLIMFLSFIPVQESFAQIAPTVTVNLNVMPPYSPYYRDYAGLNQNYLSLNNTIVTLVSNGSPQVYLVASLTKDDNTIVIRTKEIYKPPTSINLTANIPQTLTGIALKAMYGSGSLSDLSLTGVTPFQITSGQALPEGNYTLCVQARSYQTGSVYGEDCREIYISYNEPPQILSPFDLSIVPVTNPQFVLVTWTPAVTGLAGVSYRLRVAKLLPGVSATDALKNSIQLILDKSNIVTSNFLLDVASGVILDTGNAYAMQVTASSTLTFFKNNGESEPVVFYYKSSNNQGEGNSAFDLRFITPNTNKNYIEVNKGTPFYMNWNWFDADPKNIIPKIIDTAYKGMGVVKYVLKIENAAKGKKGNTISQPFSYTKTISLIHNELRSYLSFPKKVADSIGFKDQNWYKATLTAYDAQSKVVTTAGSVDFQYRIIKDEEPSMDILVNAVIKYVFKDSTQAMFNATNTTVEVDALKKGGGQTPANPPIVINNVTYFNVAHKTGTTDALGAFHDTVSVPLKYFSGDSIYLRIKLSDQYYIDKGFPVHGVKAMEKDTVVNFGQLVAETYAYSLKVYVKKAYTSYRISNKNGEMSISLADSVFHADADLYQYSSADGGTMVYNVESKQLAKGITVVMYRKNKQSYIPPVEGNLTDYSHTTGYTEVGRGITQIEKTSNGDVTYVKFNRLLASIFNGDEYYILALNGKNDPNKNNQNQILQAKDNPVFHQKEPKLIKVDPGLQNNSGYNLQNTWNNFYNPYSNLVFSEDGFIAQEMLFKLALPLNINSDDSLYRHVVANYDIVSTKPPTSLVKGRLMYNWKSDKNKQLRPLANTSFKVVVDYLVDGKPIGPVTSISMNSEGGSFYELFFVPEEQEGNGEEMELLDHGATMAVGKTDAQGNFEIAVVNINKKGYLGKGTIMAKGGSWSNPNEVTQDFQMPTLEDIINPVIGGYEGGDNWGMTGSLGIQNAVNQNNGIQNEINGHSNVGYNSSNGTFEVGYGNTGFNNGGINKPGMHGPGPDDNLTVPEMIVVADDKLVDFQRVYRIVPDNQYIYPTKDTFAVQPFEAINITKPLTSFVKEIKLQVHITDSANSDLNQMLVTVFRSISDKTPDLPLGEGNGEYVFAKLISPQYNTSGEAFDNANAQNMFTGGDVFNTKYELIWPADKNKVSSGGWADFTALLAGFDDYYIEACSDPEGSKIYKAAFSSVKTDIKDNPDYWLGLASPPPVTVTMKLYPLPSRALIRLLDNSTKMSISGTKGGRVTILKENSFNWATSYVDNDGYVEFVANQKPLSTFTSPVMFVGWATGYKSAPENGTVKFIYNATGSQYFYNYLLDAALLMKGHIVNLDDRYKAGVPSYIKVDSGKVIETNDHGYFENLPVPAVAGKKILIIPKDVGFFDSTYYVTPADISKPVADIEDFGVYRRKHRIRFVITDKNHTIPFPVENATVQLGETIKKSNDQGIVLYSFENVSVNNFTFVIRGPDGQNFIPKTLNLKNKDSTGFVTVNVKLETGSEVHGKVTLDGNPVRHAKVYLDVSEQNSSGYYQYNSNQLSPDANLVVAYSDASGNYHLHGVPADNQIIYIHATLDTSFTVNGDIQKADIKNHTATTNLALTSFKAMLVNNIYGFPLSVEKIVPTKPDSSEAKVTGVVHWSKAISNFYLDEGNQVLRIEDVTYKATTVNGKKVGVPQNTSVTIEGISSLKFKYLNKYNVKLSLGGNINTLNPQPLVITKENDLGVIKGKVAIVDNSFNFPSTYLNFSSAVNSFYLADTVNGTTVNTTIGAVTSAMTETQTNSNYYQNFSDYIGVIQSYILGYQSQPKPLYYLSNSIGKPIQFKLIEFDASANPVKSFIDVDGKIHLNVNLQCSIENAQPKDFTLNIDDMVLDNNKVYPASSTSPISLALEKWTLKVKSWSFSTEEGGIVSNDGLINTSAIDIPFCKFVLRHDLFLMDSFQLKKLTMAGGKIALKNIKDQNAALVFDNKTGVDMMPHWRFSISGDPAAELPALVDLSGTIKLNYIQILSNNDLVFQLQQQSSPLIIKTNPLAKFSPQSIYNGPDYISVAGGLNTGAPRMGDILLNMDYKDANSLKLESVQADIEGQGFVHFVARDPGNNVPNITITPAQISILGNVVEKPTPTFNEMRSTFFAIKGAHYGDPNVYKVDLDKGFVTQLDTLGNVPNPRGHKLVINNGGMSVIGSDWSILTYEGMMSSNVATDTTKPIKVKYAVMGDISADADGMKVTNVDTPFGKMKMVFDFAHKRMIGSITANNIPLGASKISGTIETLFDPHGFYIAGGCSANITMPNPYVDGVYNMGFMVGMYPVTNELWDVVNSYKNPAVKNNCYRKKNPNLSGFYFTIDRIIIDKSLDFDFILASGYVHATALIGADVYANFKKPVTIGIEAHAFAEVAAGLAAITGTSISGSLNALAALKFILEQDPDDNKYKFIASGEMNLGFQATIIQNLGIKVKKSIDINCHASGGTEGFDFSFGSGSSSECSN